MGASHLKIATADDDKAMTSSETATSPEKRLTCEGPLGPVWLHRLSPGAFLLTAKLHFPFVRATNC